VNDVDLEGYLKDLGLLIKEQALAARSTRDRNQDAYSIGALMAWHSMVSIMQSQAVLFGIDLSRVGLEAINPERDLL
jgi:hypothetical protein